MGWRAVASIMLRPGSLGLAAAIAFGTVAWQQWLHTVALDVGVHEGDVVLHWVRDSLLAVPPALLAVGIGTRAASVWCRRRRGQETVLTRSLSIGLTFAALLVPLVAVHSAIDEVLGGGGVLGALPPAPGAGYLLASSATPIGILEQAVHGGRDALLALPMAIVLTAGALLLMPVLTNRMVTSRRHPHPVPPTAIETPAPGVSAVARSRTSVLGDPPDTDLMISKRELLRYSSASAMALALGSAGVTVLSVQKAHAEETAEAVPWLSTDVELVMRDGMRSMIDGVPVYMYGWGYRSGGVDRSDTLNVPGPVLWGNSGDTIEVRVTNELDGPHSFVIDGVVDSGPIQPGASHVLAFTAPSPGTYLYMDGVNRPVNRVLGLHGTLIVMPADGSLRLHPSLGEEYWTFATQWVWMFNEIDPRFNARAQAGRTIDPADFQSTFLPRYFTLNGRMGSLAAHEETAPDTVMHDHVGNPALVRMVNAGMAMHGPHFHGNHVYPLMRNAALAETIMWKDTAMVMPEDCVDVFLPFRIPPNAVHFPPPESGRQYLRGLHGHDIEGTWPMHCHVEMSQSAGGGLYPQGLLTDWRMET